MSGNEIYRLKNPFKYTDSRTCEAVEIKAPTFSDHSVIAPFMNAMEGYGGDGDLLVPTMDVVSKMGEIVNDSGVVIDSEFAKRFSIKDVLGMGQVIANFIYPAAPQRQTGES